MDNSIETFQVERLIEFSFHWQPYGPPSASLEAATALAQAQERPARIVWTRSILLEVRK
jgi:hypothetical protein